MNPRRDPALPGLLLFGGVMLAGFLLIGLGWHIAARTLSVSDQVPALVSGGFAGIALVMIGAGLAQVLAGRRLASRERADTDEVLDAAGRVLVALRRFEP